MDIQQEFTKEEQLINSLKKVLAQEDLSQHKALVKRLSSELKVSVLDCAAALSLLNNPKLGRKVVERVDIGAITVSAKQKVVRYRLDVGLTHQVSADEIKDMLVDVSGVERKRIAWMDIRSFYTLVDLPDGMAADIFQLLSETEINNQQLNIKRVKHQRRFHRRGSRHSLRSNETKSNA